MRFEMAPLAIESATSERAAFIRRTYAHLAGAILAFTLLEVALFKVLIPELGLHEAIRTYAMSPILQLVMILAFIGVGFLARYWASNGGSPAMQYIGLGLFVVAEAVIFIPILYYAVNFFDGAPILLQASILTLSLFAGLTAVVFVTGKDFSFMASILTIASFLMLGVVLCLVVMSLTNGFVLGWGFSMAIAVFGVMLAAGFILYDTSNVMLHFRTDQHVAASLELFSSIAYLFFQILRILMLTQSRD